MPLSGECLVWNIQKEKLAILLTSVPNHTTNHRELNEALDSHHWQWVTDWVLSTVDTCDTFPAVLLVDRSAGGFRFFYTFCKYDGNALNTDGTALYHRRTSDSLVRWKSSSLKWWQQTTADAEGTKSLRCNASIHCWRSSSLRGNL